MSSLQAPNQNSGIDSDHQDIIKGAVLITRAMLLSFTLLLVLTIAPAIYISQYANPAADDFTYSYRARTDGIVKTITDEYFGWNGRYSTDLLVTLNPIVKDSFSGYKIAPVVIVLLILLATYFFIRSINFKRGPALLLSLLFTSLFLNLMPDISEGIFWYTGAVCYQAGNLLALVHLGLYFLYQSGRMVISRIFHLLLLIGSLFFVIGFNEVLTAYVILFYVLLFFLHKENRPKIISVLLICTFIFSALMFLSPGNSERESLFTENHNLFSSFINSGLQTGRFAFSWIFSPALLLTSLFFILIYNQYKNSLIVFRTISPFLSTALLFSTIFIAAFIPYWATGILGQHRTINTACFFFILLWFCNLANWCEHYKKSNIKLSPLLIKSFFIFIPLTLFFSGNTFSILNELRTGEAKRFDEQMQQRFNVLKDEGRKKTATEVSSISDRPKTLFVNDLSKDTLDWENRAYKYFFNLERTPRLKIE